MISSERRSASGVMNEIAIPRSTHYLVKLFAGISTGLLLAVIKLKAPYEMLLADRFYAGAGWIEIFVLSLYAGWLAGAFLVSSDTSRLRLRIWSLFSGLFFLQFILGVLGIERLLMTGRLHIPVPAVVIAGPLFRGERFFMPILFLATVVLVGPAWCSHLCYIGSWDGIFSSARRHATRPESPSARR